MSVFQVILEWLLYIILAGLGTALVLLLILLLIMMIHDTWKEF